MLVELAARCVAKHVIRKHFWKVVEAACAGHAIDGVVDGFVVPVVEPTFVELIEDFLFFLCPFRVVVLI